jgi:uncharacterized membrane protein YccC
VNRTDDHSPLQPPGRGLRPQLRRFFENESTRPDFGRALRTAISVAVPLALAAGGWLPLSATFVALAAQNVAMVDVRGAYPLRLALLLAMTAILTGAAALGGICEPTLGWAVLAGGLVAALGGLWRHLTPDYGASIAISSTLLFVISVNTQPGIHLAETYALSTLAGGLFGVLLQVAYWPIRPQHPLRVAVSDSWVAIADLFEALSVEDGPNRTRRINEAEAATRTALDHATAVLTAGGALRKNRLRPKLEELNTTAARLSTRVVALNTALEDILTRPDSAWLVESIQPLLRGLSNLSRSVAIAVVSRQPAHFALSEVRLRRLGNLLQTLQVRTRTRGTGDAATAQLREILRQIERQLPGIQEALRATIDRAGERGAFSLELFDLHTLTLRPLAATLTFRRPFDRALLRFAVRISVLTMLGVAVAKLYHLPHGYWLPLTTAIVLQPDYGSTRQRAVQRLAGTFIGSVAASLLLWLHLSPLVIAAAVTLTVFAFSFFIKRHYAVAVVFITLFVVLTTESTGPVTVAFTIERLAVTLVGGALALGAALYFWPAWERDRLPPILAAALEANRAYLQILAERLRAGGANDRTVSRLRRRAEAANAAAFSSLQRMMSDPRNQQEGLERAAALANGNQRVIRAFNVLSLHLRTGESVQSPEFDRFVALVNEALAALAQAATVESASAAAAPAIQALQAFDFPQRTTTGMSGSPALEHWVFGQFARIATELGAMQLAFATSPPARAAV